MRKPIGRNIVFFLFSSPPLHPLFYTRSYSLIRTYRSSFDAKSISSITSNDFSGMYCYSGLQALFVTVFQTSVDLLWKKSYKSSSLQGYLECFLSKNTVGCRNIRFRCPSQIRREKLHCERYLYNFVNLFCATSVVSMPGLANFTLRHPNFCFSPTLCANSLLKK